MLVLCCVGALLCGVAFAVCFVSFVFVSVCVCLCLGLFRFVLFDPFSSVPYRFVPLWLAVC